MNSFKQILIELEQVKIEDAYWDVRIEDSFETTIEVLNGEVVTCSASPSLGAFIRLRKNGFWFYESTTELNKIKEILLKLHCQKALHENQSYYHPYKQKQFKAIHSSELKFSDVSLDDKLFLCQKYNSTLSQNDKIVSARVRYRDLYKIKTFINSVGTQYEFDVNQGGLTLGYTLKSESSLFDDNFHIYGSQFDQLQFQIHGKALIKAIEESTKFLNAPAIEPGKYKVLLDPLVAGIFTHESFGHKSEADFMLGNAEALKEWQLGSIIASSCLTIVDDGSHVGTTGYCPIDDDGVPAHKNYLIKNGVLTGRLHSTDTSGQLNESPTGNSRALSFEWEPLVRMTSTYIEPGTESLQSLLARSEGAILLEGAKHGSGLSTFTIAPHRGYKIKANGQKEPVRVTVISGSVFETLKNVEAVSSEFQLFSSALGGCGKMEQSPLPVCYGGPYVLVKEMQVS